MKEMTVAIYHAIEQLRDEMGVSPTLREIGERCHIAHVSVMRHLDKLEQGGYIYRPPGKYRAIQILKGMQ